MSCTISSAAILTYAPATASSSLKLSDVSYPHSTSLSAATLKTELSVETMALLGSIDDKSDAAAHSSSPPDFTNRLILVFWGDDPTVYSASLTSTGCALSPARHDFSFDPTLPAVLIDPRGLVIERIDLSSGVISPRAPEATDSASNTTHKSAGGFIGLSGAGGSGGDKGRKSGNGKAPGGDGSASNQRGEDGTRGYNDSIATAVDGLVELPQMVITAVEFLTFFPHHTQWPTILFRLYRNGWSTGSMAKLILYARGLLDHAELNRRSGALRHQLRTATIKKYGEGSLPAEMRRNGHPDFVPFSAHSSGNNVDLYDVRLPIEPNGDRYEPSRAQGTLPQPARLQMLVNGVVNWPTGQDAGQLTQALRYAQANGLLHLTTRDLPALVLQRGFNVQTDASTTDYDLRGLERLNNSVANP
ncbi:hypothetical protein PRZ48_003909 [Zasmidium cellare]|uniref:Uncharacterized protein n=1 Tax=Zasmidium cellare TaxID=395010 RepID=A0ABR0EWD6_ZASCE|nr:hypothetical protein PRZ48_003909 [Zasmidium cellare]